MIESDPLFQKFKDIFGDLKSPIRQFKSPARINIIGEHVDYVGGFVLPAAIDFSILTLIQNNAREDFEFYSTEYDQFVRIERPLLNSAEYPWADYIVGVICEFEKRGFRIPGFSMLIKGNIPQGAGLSSSAALEVGVGFAINEINQFRLSKSEIALIGQAAENNFVGTNCGIMDQFIIATGKKDHCISLDTNTLEFEYHSFDLGNYEFYLINSNVKHSLKDSAYNKRRSECESALQKLKLFFPNLKNLYEYNAEISDQYGLNEDEIKRVTHITGERLRTQKVISSLETGKIPIVGKLLYECHWSLSKHFEVSCEETDFIVEFLQKKGSTGARMIGGGFGGCVLVLDLKEKYLGTSEELQKKYEQKFSHGVSFYKFSISDGVKEV